MRSFIDVYNYSELSLGCSIRSHPGLAQVRNSTQVSNLSSLTSIRGSKLAMAMLKHQPGSIRTIVLGIAVALVVLKLPTLELASGLYFCPAPLEILGTMEPCMPSIEGASPDPPTDDCCYVVRTTEPTCLCATFKGYKNSPSISVRAVMNLPHLCGRSVPVNFTCNGERVPSAGLPPSRKLMNVPME